jgi:hypothetical protein
MNFKERVKTIRRALGVFVEDDAIAELRVLGSDDGPQYGRFDDLDKMAEAAAKASGKADGVFFSLNPAKRSLKDWVKNRLAATVSAVKDSDIDRRRWLPLDFDPVRPSKSPSTDAEHEDAIAVAKEWTPKIREIHRESLLTLG